MPDVETPLCPISAIPEGAAKGFTVHHFKLFVVRRDNRLFVYGNACPHLGVELNWLPDQFLDRDGSLIQCSTHGALFTIESGLCIAGPCVDKHLTPVAHEIRGDTVWVTLPPART